jgi:hypothetical protein
MIYSCCTPNRRTAVLSSPGAILATPTVSAPGSAYAVADVLTVLAPGSSLSATVSVTSINAAGGVTAVSLVANGTSYSTATAIPTSGGKGTGCTLNLVSTPNGIDYLEVLDQGSIAQNVPARPLLLLHCLRPVPPKLTYRNVLIIGGESITGITAAWIAPAPTLPAGLPVSLVTYLAQLPSAANVLVVEPSVTGDLSPYTLSLVQSLTSAEDDPIAIPEVLPGFDPQLAEVQFTFRVDCGPNFDCDPPAPVCAPGAPTPPAINYLAKDYGSFRTIMLDRLNQLLPGRMGAGEPDLGVALAEVISYVGDLLSYRQDAIATEAYLQTAQSRVSLRRHALLVDYHVHDGANARVWMQLQVAGNPGSPIFLDRSVTRFYTYAPGMPPTLAPGTNNENAALLAGAQVFEPLEDALLYPEHNQLTLYTWGDASCCLPQGATEATLHGSYPHLKPGDVLIFEEKLGPATGASADADLRHRCAVRLTTVATHDSGGSLLVDMLYATDGTPLTSLTQTPTPITEIEWSTDDALPFPLCLSSTYVDDAGNSHSLANVSTASANIVLADHGLSFSNLPLGTVPAPLINAAPLALADRCQPSTATALPVRFRPPVPYSPLTQAVPLPLTGPPVTPQAVLFGGTAPVTLTDTNGSPALTIQALKPSAWPGYFGVLVKANATTPTAIDLSVVYNPPGNPSGFTAPVVVESFTVLSFVSTAANYVATQINARSNFLTVPTPYTPPATPPATYPTTPTMLSPTGPINLQDASNPPVTYLPVQAKVPSRWPLSFGVLAEGSPYTLQVVYAPSGQGVGASLPVVLEQFQKVSLSTIAAGLLNTSHLLTLTSFGQTPSTTLSAVDLIQVNPSGALPSITLTSTNPTTTWQPQQDLLDSGTSDPNFVVEVESDGTATLRFGDNTNGLAPETGSTFIASIRIGGGSAGNVGAESLTFKAAHPSIQSCTNPMPATGGTDPETTDQIRRRAPQAFLTQDRAVTLTDYEAIAEQNSSIDQAVATLRWTGSWYTVFIAAEPQGGGNLTPTLRTTVQTNLEQFRLVGQDLELESPQYVSLEIELTVTVDPTYFQANVEQSLLAVLGNRLLPNGQKGLFYPDNFTFGQTVYLSPVYAAARSVAGVVSVVATTFQLQGTTSAQYLAAGAIRLGSLQIARLENDPSYPDHGQLTLIMEGGK